MKPLFSNREIRAVAVLLVVAGVVAGAVWLARPKIASQVDTLATEELTQELDSRPERAELSCFDPNTIDYKGLRRLGLSKYEAVSLLKYRASGKVFRIPEDVAMCYGFSDSLYFALEPYISIDSRYAIKSRGYNQTFGQKRTALLDPTPFLVDTVSVRFLMATGMMSRRQSEAFVRVRDMRGIRSMDEVRDLRFISDSLALVMEPYIRFTLRPDPLRRPVELNTADSATLRSVYGIGAKSVVAIMRYRERLGGFYRVEQLTEIPEVTEGNFEKILKQIRCDSCEIQKIDVNFAPSHVLSRHPYLPPRIVRRLLKARQLKGGWVAVGDLVEQDILTPEEAARLTPYLRFGTTSQKD